MIQANCRDRFTGQDFQFIVNTLSRRSRSKKVALTELITDRDSRDTILDDETLFDEITETPGFRNVSPFLYFYLLTRNVFRQNAIEERDLADYVACMLVQFCTTRRTHTISHQHDKEYHYLVDMMTDSLEASSFEAFLMRSHLGNYALFVSGIFPSRVRHRSTYGRKSPGFDYYEQMGRSSYRWAAQHQLAPKFSLEEILGRLAEGFRAIRLALNQLSDNYMSLDRRSLGIEQILRQILAAGPRQDGDL